MVSHKKSMDCSYSPFQLNDQFIWEAEECSGRVFLSPRDWALYCLSPGQRLWQVGFSYKPTKHVDKVAGRTQEKFWDPELPPLLRALALALACGHYHCFCFVIYFSLSPFLQQPTESGDDEEDQPLSLAWPSNPRKQVTFLIVLPIVFPLWMTLPDVRKPVSRAFLNWFLV